MIASGENLNWRMAGNQAFGAGFLPYFMQSNIYLLSAIYGEKIQKWGGQ